MPSYVVKRAAYALNEKGKTISRSKILVLGVSYKRDIDDMRESPAIEIIEEIHSLGGQVTYHDPFVGELKVGEKHYTSAALTGKLLGQSDLAIIVTDHSNVDYKAVIEESKLILDTRNVLKRMQLEHKKVIVL
jgi:UDP-N-acetyl-D-glucosamine dehydrogenase